MINYIYIYINESVLRPCCTLPGNS